MVEGILAADKAAIGQATEYNDAYSQVRARREASPRKRLSDSITAVASLITMAWEQAGKPELPLNPCAGCRSGGCPAPDRPGNWRSGAIVESIHGRLSRAGHPRPLCALLRSARDTPSPRDTARRHTGLIHGLTAKFQHVLATIERRANEKTADTPTTFAGRAKERAYHWLARWIAAQRLLWRLRKTEHATLVFPDDLEPARAQGLLAAHLDRESRRHAILASCYGVLGLLTIPIVLVPGPNVVGYVFTFLLVGHFSSHRGARHGRTRVTWVTQSSATLVELRRLPSIAPGERERFIHEIAERLGLVHLVAFFERVALGGA